MLRRTPLKPGKGFKRPAPKPAKVYEVHTPRDGCARELRMTDARARMSVPVPKDRSIQNAAYMAAVRRLPCALCGKPGPSQFCHADILGSGGKGKGMKSDCRLGWPGCGPTFSDPGCHWIVGTSGRMTKEERHAFEAEAGRLTRAAVFSAWKWPKNLPRWPED